MQDIVSAYMQPIIEAAMIQQIHKTRKSGGGTF